jgi:hypothetical protein
MYINLPLFTVKSRLFVFVFHSVYLIFLQEVLGERVKAFLTWQNALNSLQKRREQRSRMELGGKLDRMGAVLEVCPQNTTLRILSSNF